MKVEADKCGDCGYYRMRPASLPAAPCSRCSPREHHRVLFEHIESQGARIELIVYASPFDRLQQELTLADEAGHLYKLTMGYGYPFNAIARDAQEKLVEELQRLREENRDVLAENARMRRRLEKP